MNDHSIDFEAALTTLGKVLAARGIRYEVVAVGGGALSILGLITRPTRDIDIVAVVRDGELVSAKDLPDDLVRATADVAQTLGLASDWLNSGPTSLLDLGLPDGFEKRMIARRYEGLTVHLAGRLDQIFFKFYAAVDQGPRSKHVDDLRRLGPTASELLSAAEWARSHDPSPGFHEMSHQALNTLGLEDEDDRG
jgi:hypothetical protein